MTWKRRGTVLATCLLGASACHKHESSPVASTGEPTGVTSPVRATPPRASDAGVGARVDAAMQSEAPSPAQALFDPGQVVDDDEEIRVDGEVVAHIGSARRGEAVEGFFVDAAYSSHSLRRFGVGSAVYVSGLIDLHHEGRIPTAHLPSATFRSSNMQLPTLVLRIETVDASESEIDSDPRGARGRGDGVHSSEDLLLLDARDLRQIFFEMVRERIGDGFGGFDLDPLNIEVHGSKISVRGSRQDHLPAERAGCMKPEPVPVRYDWDGHSLVHARAANLALPSLCN